MPRTSHPHLRLVSAAGAEPDMAAAMTIDCDRCVRQHSTECDDCVVSYLVDHDPATPVVFGRQEQKAVDLLADAGLIPRSKFEAAHVVA